MGGTEGVKGILSTVMCVVLALALIVFAVGSGAVRGWQGERTKALDTLRQSTDMASLLENRAMDAANLSVVAARHLDADHPDLLALKNAYAILTSDASPAADIAAADAALTQAAVNLAQLLPELPSVQADQRDQVYVSTLTRTLAEMTSVADVFDAAVKDFNRRLASSPTGQLAMFLGVEPLPVQ